MAPEDSFTRDDFETAPRAAYDPLDAKDNDFEKEMGATRAFLKLYNDDCFITHIGTVASVISVRGTQRTTRRYCSASKTAHSSSSSLK